MARTVAMVKGTFETTGVSETVSMSGYFNVSVAGFGTATVALQRSFDDGATWRTRRTYTADAEEVLDEPERGVLYRFECGSFTAGPVGYRVSQ